MAIDETTEVVVEASGSGRVALPVVGPSTPGSTRKPGPLLLMSAQLPRQPLCTGWG